MIAEPQVRPGEEVRQLSEKRERDHHFPIRTTRADHHPLLRLMFCFRFTLHAKSSSYGNACSLCTAIPSPKKNRGCFLGEVAAVRRLYAGSLEPRSSTARRKENGIVSNFPRSHSPASNGVRSGYEILHGGMP